MFNWASLNLYLEKTARITWFQTDSVIYNNIGVDIKIPVFQYLILVQISVLIFLNIANQHNVLGSSTSSNTTILLIIVLLTTFISLISHIIVNILLLITWILHWSMVVGQQQAPFWHTRAFILNGTAKPINDAIYYFHFLKHFQAVWLSRWLGEVIIMKLINHRKGKERLKRKHF